MSNRRSTARDLAQIAIFAALIAALGAPGTIATAGPVPITLQTLGVMLAGAILGARKGFLAVLTFEVLTFAGLPLLAGGRGGVVWFTTAPSAGFVWSWLPAAALIGLLTGWILPRYPLWLGILITAVGGMVLVYTIGIPVMAINGHLSLGHATALNSWYLVGDSAKVIVTAVVAKRVHRSYPGLIRARRTGRPLPAIGTATEVRGTTPLSDRFETGADAEGIAICAKGREVSYAEFDSLVDDFAAPGSGVLDLSELDVVSTLVAVFAAARSGFTVVLGDPDSQLPPLPVLPPDSFLVAMTSGSSGRHRVVVRSVPSWLSSFRPFADLTGLCSDDVVLLTGPLHSTLHLFAAIHTLWLGAQLTDDPAAATAVHAVPTALADLLEDPPPGLRTAVVAGALLPRPVEQRALGLGVRLIEYYGAAELSFVGIRVCPGPMIPFPAVSIRVVDSVLWARSPYLALQRFVISTHRTLTGELITDDGFASAGDLAEIAEDGSLVVRGRGDQAVTTGGHTVVVEDVETAISGLAGVAAVAVVGMPHDRFGQIVTAVVELRSGTEIAAVRRAARQRLHGPALPRRWQVVAALPRTASGKVARGLIVAQLTGEGSAGRDRRGPELSVRTG